MGNLGSYEQLVRAAHAAGGPEKLLRTIQVDTLKWALPIAGAVGAGGAYLATTIAGYVRERRAASRANLPISTDETSVEQPDGVASDPGMEPTTPPADE